LTDWLIDTPLFMHLAPSYRRKPSFKDWIGVHGDQVYLSVVSIFDIAAAIDKNRRGDHASALKEWLERLIERHSDRIYSVDPAVALRAGALAAQHIGTRAKPADFLLAATAQVHGLGLVTSDAGLFKLIMRGSAVRDPFDPVQEATS
jgi:predicted nucleic acid-binding protein